MPVNELLLDGTKSGVMSYELAQKLWGSWTWARWSRSKTKWDHIRINGILVGPLPRSLVMIPIW